MCQCVSEGAAGSRETCVSEGVGGTVRVLSVGGRSIVRLSFGDSGVTGASILRAVEDGRCSHSLMTDELEALRLWVKVWLRLAGFRMEVGRVRGLGDVSGDPPQRAARVRIS